MNLAQMIKEVRRALDEPTADFWTDEEITDWLNEGAKIMTSGAQPLQAFYQFSTVAGQQEYAMPDDFDELFEVKYFRSNLTTLKLTSPAAAQNGNSQGLPQYFYMRSVATQSAGQGADGDIQLGTPGTTFKTMLGLIDKPSQSGDKVTVFYFSQHFSMTNDTDVSPIPVAFHRGPISYATAMGKQKDEAYGEQDKFLAMFKDFADSLKKKTINAGQETAFPQLRVVDEDYWEPSNIIVIPDGSAS